MATPRFQLTAVWKRTLAPQRRGDNHEASRERLRSAFINFRDRAAQLGNEIARDLPFFTVHDVSHLDALWELIDLIAGPEYPLTPSEAFILGGAILVHDLAMSQAAFQNEFARLKTEPQWRDTVASLLRTKNNRIPKDDEIANPDTDTEKLAIQTLLRELHARQAAELPLKEWGHAGTRYYLLDDADLRAAFADDIGKVAFSHHWPLEQLLEPMRLFQGEGGGPGWLPPEWKVDLVKLACLLRTADAAHADDRRAPGFLAALRQPSGLSELHWQCQSLMRMPHIANGDDRLRYRSNRPFKIEESDAWWIALDWLRLVDRELWMVDDLLADIGRPRLVARGVWNVDSPGRLALDLRTDGWEPIDAEVRISDTASIVRMLGGDRLYGNRPEVPLRELIQNAADAIRARRKLQSRDTTFGRILIRPGNDPSNEEWIEVIDNGIGMSKAVLAGTLLDFGAGFWGTSRMWRELPGLEALGMEATGQFGIGFFSVFMWGDRVRVTTRRYDRGHDETWVLEFRKGVGLRPLLRKASLEEQQSIQDGGTIVRVWCNPSNQVHERLLRQEPPSEASCSWEQLCQWIAPALDVNLAVEILGSTTTAVDAQDWLSIDAEKMLLRLNWKGQGSAVPTIYQDRNAWSFVTSCMRIVTDDAGKPIARGTVWSTQRGYVQEGCTVCGGLRSESAANFTGIQFAKPETAARQGMIQIEASSGWAKWAEDQKAMDDPQLPEWIRAQAAIRLVPFVHPGQIPIGICEKGWVSLEEFTPEIRGVVRFRCVASALWAAEDILKECRDIPTLIVNGSYVLNQIDGRSFSLVRLLQEIAEKEWGAKCEVSNLNKGMNAIMVRGQLVSTHHIELLRCGTLSSLNV